MKADMVLAFRVERPQPIFEAVNLVIHHQVQSAHFSIPILNFYALTLRILHAPRSIVVGERNPEDSLWRHDIVCIGNRIKARSFSSRATEDGHRADGEFGLGMVTTRVTEATGNSTKSPRPRRIHTGPRRPRPLMPRSSWEIQIPNGDRSGHGGHGKYKQNSWWPPLTSRRPPRTVTEVTT